jgi:hypothetical protein
MHTLANGAWSSSIASLTGTRSCRQPPEGGREGGEGEKEGPKGGGKKGLLECTGIYFLLRNCSTI